MVYTKLAINFLEDRSWQETKSTEKQFTKFIELLLAINITVMDTQDCGFIPLQTIA